MDHGEEDRWFTEDPTLTGRDAHLCCDRGGVLRVTTHVPDGMLPIIEAPWLGLKDAVGELALRAPDGRAWIVPGVPEAGEDSTAALAAISAFRLRLIAALKHPPGASVDREDLMGRLRARLYAPPPPPLEALRNFLRHCCDMKIEEIEASLRRMKNASVFGARQLDRYAGAIEAVLADPPPKGTLAKMVAWDANWVLEDETDAGAIEWLREMMDRIRRIQAGDATR